MTRMNFATSYVTGQLRGVGLNGDRLFGEVRERGGDLLSGLLDTLLPAVDHSELTTVIQEDLQANPPAGERAGRLRALSLILGSPHFQRH